MTKAGNSGKFCHGVKIALFATTLLAAAPAYAQLTTATIRGEVSNGAVVAPGAIVTAVQIETRATTTATAGPDGSYILTGLRPGTYDITVSAAGGAPGTTQRVIVSVGQTATLDLDAAAPAAAAAEAGETGATPAPEGDTIIVTATRLVETKTSEVATNITRDQIENLPQNNRNFLNFAALAPGIRVLQTDERQTFGGGGVGLDRNGEATGGPQVNVFIDGVSLKSNLQQGGIVGQDASRGNPFSQLAVQEFRVLTSNFKAEYEDAGTSIVTAITKSGTNTFHGELFGTYQNKGLIDRNFFQRQRDEDKPELKRYQYGGALGGPIIADNLFFFASYEANTQDRTLTVTPGTVPADVDLPFDPQSFAGSFVSPFREHLGFGKLSWQIADHQLLEATASIRKETDFRSFGGQAAQSRGSSVENDVYTAKLRHQWEGNGFVNELSADYLKSDLRFGADFGEGFGLNYNNIIQIGARADFQEAKQEGLTFRNNLSLSEIQWNGDHLVKLGAKLSFQKFRVGGSGPDNNPQFTFTRDPSRDLDFDIAEVVRFGSGDPEFSASTTQIGFFAQDDWRVNDRLTLNLGLRWDIDTNARNRDFETSERATEALLALGEDPRLPDFVDVEDYISTGNNRKIDYNNFAPRIGASYDINADQKTVVFAAYGRYYDRALYRNAAEEALLDQYQQSEVLFSRDGLPRNGAQTVIFDPRFLTPEGFQDLRDDLATRNFPEGQLRVIPNNFQTPYTDQFSIGIRHRFGVVRASATFNLTYGHDQVAYVPLNRTDTFNAGGFYDGLPLINGYNTVVAATNDRKSRYRALFLQADKPYSEASGWGAGIAYTLAHSKGRGFEFNFDFPYVFDRPFVPNFGDERHRVVVNGMVDLPLDFRLSSLATYGSGVPIFFIDAREGFGPRDIRFPGNVLDTKSFFQIDMRLQKVFKLLGREFTVFGEVFNLLDEDNIARRDTFACCGNEVDTTPTDVIGPPRSFQFGSSVRF